MWLELTWYGMCIADEQEEGYGKFFIELNDGKYQTYCDQQTYLRLKHLDKIGIDLPGWCVAFLSEKQRMFE